MRNARLATLVIAVMVCVAMPVSALTKEVIDCVERGDCQLTNVCSFVLAPDPSRCFKQTCTNATGHLMQFHNGLAYAINVTWDVLGSPEINGVLRIESESVRYFNTYVDVAHTIRLRVDDEIVDTVITRHDDMCTTEQACDYLLRACYGPTDDKQCVDYARHCHGFSKVDDEKRTQCIPSCLATYYDHLVKSPYDISSDAIVDVIVQQQAAGVTSADVFGSKTLQVNANGELSYSPSYHHPEDDETSTEEVWIFVLVITVIIFGGLACWLSFRECRNHGYIGDHHRLQNTHI